MQTYKPHEFAEKIGVSVSTLQRWDRDGLLPANRTPAGRRYYTSSDVEEYFRTTDKPHDGRWICVTEDGKHKHKCSICGKVYEDDDNFCGNCGARMVWDKTEKENLRQKGVKLNADE